MIEKKHVDGEQKTDIVVYALSTCGWCRKTKAYLKELGVAYDYIDVDRLEKDDKQAVLKSLKEFGSDGSYPTTIINNKDVVTGYDVDRIDELLGQY